MTLITLNNLSKADGSALIEQDNTIIQATVFGPVDISQSRVNYEEAVVDILFRPRISIPVTNPQFDHVREVENVLRCVFKEVVLTRLHPRTSISILVQEIHNGGSLLGPIINAVCCALIDAGVPMKCPVSGVTVEAKDKCKVDFVFDNKLNMVMIRSRGFIEEAELKEILVRGQKLAESNFDIIREKVRERFTS